MLDVLAAAPRIEGHAVIHRADYRPPDWLVPDITLTFDLKAEATTVRAALRVTRNGAHDRPLILDGGGQRPLRVVVDGVDRDDWRMEGDALVVALAGDAHEVETECVVHPDANTQLMGLYASGGLLCTQCEAEGFRRITFFPDRPDVLSTYRVRMTADATLYPVLLSNGNRTAAGELDDGRHWAEWYDPFPKPAYLFALVAGDLKANRDRFTTMSGRSVELAIWVAAADVPRTRHAMSSLKAAMAWDERVYGREYDLDLFNIVAVADFNFGAMENKSLNIFNSRYILADPDTATDADYDAIAAVVAHEYFHNWSGNRVTCRDWFQLSLKEGFTVYRDQGFSADQGSPAVKRIEDVRMLRATQFPEDAGPLAHPVRPESFIEISNFYTSTIYNKGAEVIRMMATMLGPQAFRAGTDLYFQRHDGEAATCEDFVRAIEDGADADLAQFRLWYSQAGTPRVRARLDHGGEGGRAMLSLAQTLPDTPGQSDKAPMVIPLRLKLFGADSGRPLTKETIILLHGAQSQVAFDGLTERPVLSINRGFSAPIIVEASRDAADLAFLSAHDDDPFARYEAMQQLMLDTLVAVVSGRASDPRPVIGAVGATLGDDALDRAFVAEAVLLPSEAFIGDQMLVVDPAAIHDAREELRGALGRDLETRWRGAYLAAAPGAFAPTADAKAKRRMRAVALGYLAAAGVEDADDLAFAHFDRADNMTDRMAGLTSLVGMASDLTAIALDIFYNRFKGDALVIDKWFATQALSPRATLASVTALAGHRDFALTNPNRARALVGSFGVNQFAFHGGGADGYAWYADQLIALDRINPQTAAKLLPPLTRWRRFDERRQALMRAELERIVAVPGLSRDMAEQAGRSLA